MISAISVVVATLGIPLPQQVVKNITELFPCMNCGCGCTDAATCWKECCCHSTEEKLAWAKEHGVEPPAFLLALASISNRSEIESSDTSCAETQAEELDAELASLKPCCRARVLAARQAAQPSCCQKRDKAKPMVTLPGIIAIHALKCHGHSLTVSLLPPSVPTDKIGTELPLLPLKSFCLTQANLYQPPCFDTVLPPPEFAAI